MIRYKFAFKKCGGGKNTYFLLYMKKKIFGIFDSIKYYPVCFAPSEHIKSFRTKTEAGNCAKEIQKVGLKKSGYMLGKPL